MSGILYGVGVGPGDPELMTLKAVRMIRENEVIAVPGANVRETVAYKIAVQAAPELAEKELLPIYMPMTHDKQVMEENHQKGALEMEAYLKEGKNVVFLTLGDPTIYSTFTYLQKIVESHGFQTALVSGITSFCAAAARINQPLVEWNQQLHVLPAVHQPSGTAGDIRADEIRKKNGAGKRYFEGERPPDCYGRELRYGK